MKLSNSGIFTEYKEERKEKNIKEEREELNIVSRECISGAYIQ